jgi:hypothetical protein
MHEPVKDNLEDYLRGLGGKFARRTPADMQTHLDSCGECASELELLEQQALSLRALRAPAGLEPRAGFYARVMQRIDEARAANTVWSAFLDPIFGRRLVYASVTLALLLGAYLVSTEPRDYSVYQTPPTVSAPATQAAISSDDADGVATPQERDAVLVNLAAYQE